MHHDDRPRPRARSERVRDTRARLATDVDVWVATAGPEGGAPYVVPLSFDWDGREFVLGTVTSSPTARNIEATGAVRLALGQTRDVVLIAGRGRRLSDAEATATLRASFAARTGFDPGGLDGYSYYAVRPDTIQAWRESNELAGRTLMRAGRWLDEPGNT